MNLYPQDESSKPIHAMKSSKHEAQRHFNEGMDHQQNGRLDDAKASYLHAIKADRSLAAAYNNRNCSTPSENLLTSSL
jgi:hypothetical protein